MVSNTKEEKAFKNWGKGSLLPPWCKGRLKLEKGGTSERDGEGKEANSRSFREVAGLQPWPQHGECKVVKEDSVVYLVTKEDANKERKLYLARCIVGKSKGDPTISATMLSPILKRKLDLLVSGSKKTDIRNAPYLVTVGEEANRILRV
uniref:Uncharacterized protein n=1 Tax=Nelumbo nucifera TaxID=4432 RepID=A0A822YVK1_NELNU|nr:TPA_asm: hypothetical protein HUJ06_007181 [Nelumbo nucifera]